MAQRAVMFCGLGHRARLEVWGLRLGLGFRVSLQFRVVVHVMFHHFGISVFGLKS